MKNPNRKTQLTLHGVTRVLSAGRASVALLVSAPFAYAAGTVSNSATATGTYNAAPVNSAPGTASVPLADPTESLLVSKTGMFNDGGDGNLDPGDTITFT